MDSISHRAAGRSFPPSYLDRLYPIPRPMVSLDEWRRFHGHDLALLDDLALLRERRCVQRRLDYEPDVLRRAWLKDRLAAIDRERGTRRVSTARVQAPRPMAEPRQRTRPTAQTLIVAGQTIELPVTSGRRGHE